MALGPGDNNDKTLFYHSLASLRESSVPTSIIKNEQNFLTTNMVISKQFQTSKEARNYQSAGQAFDKNG